MKIPAIVFIGAISAVYGVPISVFQNALSGIGAGLDGALNVGVHAVQGTTQAVGNAVSSVAQGTGRALNSVTTGLGNMFTP
jgi:hypothetical protein